jgi:hypothetical protein
MPRTIYSNQPMHIHPHLSIYLNGRRVGVPANVGIDPEMHVDHSLDRYSGGHGPAPIHTHDRSGTLHVEANKTMDFRLGDFFRIWGVDLSNVPLWVNADGRWSRNVDGVRLKDGQEIAVVIET